MNETGCPVRRSLLEVVAQGRNRRSCSSSDNEVAGAVLQNWFFVQDFWPMGQRFSLCCPVLYFQHRSRSIRPSGSKEESVEPFGGSPS